MRGGLGTVPHVTEFAVSTNLISWAPAQAEHPFFGWPQNGPEAEVVQQMAPGDILIPKFSQNPEYRRGGGQKEYQQGVCEVLGLDYQEQLDAYRDRVAWGEGAVPFLLRSRELMCDALAKVDVAHALLRDVLAGGA